MAYQLRPYQALAVNALYDYFRKESGHPIVVLPTGTGKSLVIAEFIRTALHNWPTTRIIVATHSKELVQQNHAELFALAPEVKAGIYSAGIGRHDTRFPVTFAGIQSVYKRAVDFQHIDVLIVDECHTISASDEETRWMRFIDELSQINPLLKVIGLSATPYRMNSGSLTNGKLFSKIVYEYGILQAVNDGYLAPAIPLDMSTKLDVRGVHKRGGEFIAGELERAVDVQSVTEAAVAEIVKHGFDRKSWLLFCTGVKHTEHVTEAVRLQGIDCVAITGDTPKAERDESIARFKSGQLRAIANCNVLTTGFNAPAVDLIAMLRPTASAGLYVQMVGRGMRTAPGKTNCIVLDHAGNTARHGPVDMIKVKEPGNGNGEAPIKVCPIEEGGCAAIVYAGVRVCPHCGFEFPFDDEPKITAQSRTEAILSTQRAPTVLNVTEVLYYKHTPTDGRKPTLRVDYRCGLSRHSEWVALEHSGIAREKACAWWRRRSALPAPLKIDDALKVADGLAQPATIAVEREGKYWRVVKVEF